MKWVHKCLTSIRASTHPIQVIIIDNLSADGTPEYVKQHFPEAILIEAGANLGFGKANNIGIKKALDEGADYAFILNQDTWIEPSCIEELILVHKTDTSFGIISPFHISGDNKSLEFKFIEYIQPNVCPGLISDYFMNSLQPVYETTFVNAAAWMVSIDCIKTVGGFDPLYPHYGEDVDYIQRAQYFKYKVGITANAKIWHDSKTLTWPEIMFNRKRMMTIYLSEVKSVNGSLRSNTLVFLKRRFDDTTSHLLFRRWKLFSYHLGLTISTLRQLPKISKARKASFIKGAFLEKSN